MTAAAVPASNADPRGLPPRVRGVRDPRRRAALRRVQDQGRPPFAVLLQRGAASATARALGELGGYYARAALASGIGFDMLFGPAYKGITLAAATAIALAGLGHNVPFCFNRKEAKDHGEGGNIVGAPLEGRALIIDDVITDGASKREAIEIIRAAGATPAGVLIALDRQERGQGGALGDPGSRPGVRLARHGHCDSRRHPRHAARAARGSRPCRKDRGIPSPLRRGGELKRAGRMQGNDKMKRTTDRGRGALRSRGGCSVQVRGREGRHAHRRHAAARVRARRRCTRWARPAAVRRKIDPDAHARAAEDAARGTGEGEGSRTRRRRAEAQGHGAARLLQQRDASSTWRATATSSRSRGASATRRNR